MRDAGLQPERTALAWARTSLAMMVNSALVARMAIVAHRPSLALLAVLMLLLALALHLVARQRQRDLSLPPPRALSGRVCLLLASTLALAAAGASAAIAERALSGYAPEAPRPHTPGPSQTPFLQPTPERVTR